MINKKDLLKNESIKIISYNYEKYKGFSMETAVDTLMGVYNEHKLLVEIEDEKYEVILKNTYETLNYENMEDEYVTNEAVYADKEVLNIRKLDKNNPYRIPELVLTLENDRLNKKSNFDEEVDSFIKKLIKSAENLGIGINYNDHRNTEDDYARTYTDKKNEEPFVIIENLIFIKENEKEIFKEYIKITDINEEENFINNLKNKFNENNDTENKNLSVVERFKILKTYINNEISYEEIPSILKKAFEIKDKVTSILTDKIDGNNKYNRKKIKFSFDNK